MSHLLLDWYHWYPPNFVRLFLANRYYIIQVLQGHGVRTQLINVKSWDVWDMLGLLCFFLKDDQDAGMKRS